MNSFKQTGTSQRNSNQQQNSFARALAEAEKRSGSSKKSLAGHSRGRISDSEQSIFNADSVQQADQEKKLQQLQKEKEEELKKRQMREKLHKMVNPVEQSEIFNAREEQRQQQIEEVRKELKKLALEIAKFYQEVDVTLTQEVVSPGMEGTYHQNFFEKLKQFIIMLRQRVRSARTWARQMKAKKKKKGPRMGLDFGGNEAKATHDMLHHERSNAYTGA